MNLTENELDKLLDVLPTNIRKWASQHIKDDIIEIVMDCGLEPEIRYTNSYIVLQGYKVSLADILSVTKSLGPFGVDNRSGIDGTLHRISAIRHRNKEIIGLTLRVGRAISGYIGLIQDFLDTGESVLLLGKPASSKTSKLREACHYLSVDKHKRVVIVDTSNEIAGEGSVPHAGVGRSRRMMVPVDRQQHKVMIEAVENHTPQVVVIDEISTSEEAYAARTIAERGVQLLATAHGHTLENLLANDPLTPLIGKVRSQTMSDEYFNKNGSKSRLERIFPATFTKIVELISFNEVAIHTDTEHSVDCILDGGIVMPEIRVLEDGIIKVRQKTQYTKTEYVETTKPRKK